MVHIKDAEEGLREKTRYKIVMIENNRNRMDVQSYSVRACYHQRAVGSCDVITGFSPLGLFPYRRQAL